MQIHKKIILLMMLFGGLSACDKSLDLMPTDVITDENAFKDVASLESGMVGAYATFNGTVDNDIYASALYSDEATLPSENTTGRGVIAYRWQGDAGTGEITAAWAAYYFGIDRANRVLEAIDNVTSASSAENETKSRIRGEGLALRAFGHLQLLINFSNGYDPNALSVPYIEKSGIQTPSRLTAGEVMAKIRADLAQAATLIPTTFTTRTRITLPAVYAIQARAALYAKNWDEAITAATTAINGVPLETRSLYPSIWTDVSNVGVIWKHKREAGGARIGRTFYDDTQDKIVYGPSEELRLLFDQVNDIRYATLVQLRGADRYSLGKYIGGTSGEPGRADIKVFRTAEMYLIRAEAYAEKNDLVNAAADINMLRTNRITGYTPVSFTSKQAAIDAIMLERFKELAFEGHRIYDLRRRLLPVTRIPADAINALGATTLNPTDRVYYFPIPNAEILANPNVVQNPGYL
jgi:starch-binding outer membrane protein, SusD/RagB family